METSILATSLRSVISTMIKRLRRTVHSIDNFSITEQSTLSYLYPNEAFSPTELANILKVKPQSMSELLIKLHELGIITKTPSATDGRKSYITLTDSGREVVEKTRYERDEWLTQAIDHLLSDQEKLVLQQAVGLMAKICDYK